MTFSEYCKLHVGDVILYTDSYGSIVFRIAPYDGILYSSMFTGIVLHATDGHCRGGIHPGAQYAISSNWAPHIELIFHNET